MLPNTTGIGLKAAHYDQILESGHGLDWFELHPENYMGQGGLPHKYLTEIRKACEISMHGVGMSLGTVGGVDPGHLARLKALVERYQPAQVSEHISWSTSSTSGIFHNDLLPLPYSHQSLDVLCDNIDHVQTTLGRQILVENPSTYMAFETSRMSEPEYIFEVQKRSGCKLLLDVNNVYVSATNNGFDAYDYIDALPLHAVGEIHLAGHAVETLGEAELLIDDHGSPVTEAVWKLHVYTLTQISRPVPVLIEWDNDVPEFSVMLDEVQKANRLNKQCLQADYSAQNQKSA